MHEQDTTTQEQHGPCLILGLPGDQAGEVSYSLSFYARDDRLGGVLVLLDDACDFTDGYAWERFIRSMIARRAPHLEGALDFDPEMGMFAVNCGQIEPLRLLACLLDELIVDPQKVRGYLALEGGEELGREPGASLC